MLEFGIRVDSLALFFALLDFRLLKLAQFIE